MSKKIFFRNPAALFFAAAQLMVFVSAAQQPPADYPIKPVSFTQVKLTDEFWRPRLETNAKVTIPYILEQCRRHGRLDNFLIAAHKKKGKLTAFPFDDTDVYKLIEGASYSLQESYDAHLDRQLDTLIRLIGDAQEPDGYLYTFRTAQAQPPHDWIGAVRWEKEEILSHELYNAGHLYEAAVAHYQATKKRSLLDIAIKNANLLVRTFGPGKLKRYPGHQIVELGLAKMYRTTGTVAYLKLAKFFLDARGGGESYNQADTPVVDQSAAEGHAVRAAYMYTGMADVAAMMNDLPYLHAIDTIWEDVALRKLYITGGIGATGSGEAFGGPYELPNMSAYAETCAAIGNVYWNERMFLLHGDARYIDVLERTLYNGLLSGISLTGNRFFYPNPLASVGQHARSAWFDCACCISNMTRFLPSMPGYIYAQDDKGIFVNLFAGNRANIRLKSGEVKLAQTTDFPWSGSVAFAVDPAQPASFSLRIRIPGWARNEPIPGSDLYAFRKNTQRPVDLFLNGERISYSIANGYAVIDRRWKAGDKLRLELPMTVEEVVANPRVKADTGRLAFQRGPLVYCIEGADQKDSAVMSVVADTAAGVQTVFRPGMLNGITTLQFTGYEASRDSASANGSHTVTAIPYYSWNNRGSGEMEVWIPYKTGIAVPRPLPSIASKATVTASHGGRLMLKALNDQYVPADSRDQSANYLHFWPAKDKDEWVQYDFDQPYTISKSSVYWYDDKPWGGCDLPASWQLLYKKEDAWVPVENTIPYEIAKDKFNTVTFKPVTTTALRLVLRLPKNDASGIHEWSVE